MATAEFDLINRYFTGVGEVRADVALGVGDDCALLQPPEGQQLAVSIDTLVEGVHFLPAADPYSLGFKALAVNLSDLAAMGAEPAWVTLALTLPAIDEDWLAGFSRGFSELAVAAGVALVGGDTTRGPLSITIQVHGLVPVGEALRRDGARPGDQVYVTGNLGEAALALRIRQGLYHPPQPMPELDVRLDRPQPQLTAGRLLRGIASAAIDLSDGLLADLGHICQRSGVAAEVQRAQIPCTESLKQFLAARDDWSPVLAGGDDYELCFTVPRERETALILALSKAGVGCSRIGVIEKGSGVRCVDERGLEQAVGAGGYDHFHHLS